jgi:hypothetical protein
MRASLFGCLLNNLANIQHFFLIVQIFHFSKKVKQFKKKS